VWILNAFKALSGIRINYSKTKLILINLSQEEVVALASLVCCKLSTFLLKYLGVPLSDAKLKISDWQDLIDKIQRKIPNWKGSLLSIGGSGFIGFCAISYSFCICYPFINCQSRLERNWIVLDVNFYGKISLKRESLP
jgi:hypothetical protein